MMHQLQRYWQYWLKIASIKFQESFVNRGTNVLFLAGKLIRLGMTVAFLLTIVSSIPTFATYTTQQLLIFFLTFQIIDVVAQTLFRGVYMFTYEIRRGDFDFSLIKPINPLFKALIGHPDFNDALFLLPTLAVVGFLFIQSGVDLTLHSAVLYLLLLANGLLLAAALHICMLALGILTMEVDGFIWLYRDITFMGQLPVSVYQWPVQILLTIVVPVAIMVSVPAQQLIGAHSTLVVLGSLCFGATFFWVSIQLWRFALQRYTSASS